MSALKKKSAKPWKCKHGCPVSKDACRHLEALLPHNERGSHKQPKITYIDNIEKLSYLYYNYNRSVSQEDVDAFVAKLQKYGMETYQVSLLLDRFVYDKTIAEITKERGFTSTGACFYVVDLAIKQLKERGYGPTSVADREPEAPAGSR